LRKQVRGAWRGDAGGVDVRWVVSDQLGTPRMAADRAGSLAGVTRHDYLPFGEELSAGTGGRATAQGYGAADNVRQQFTKKERDTETNLDFFEARYYSSVMGRFTSPDEFRGGPEQLFYFEQTASDNPTFYAGLEEPQSLNKYVYCLNNPLRYVDPSGHQALADAVRQGTDALQKVAPFVPPAAISVLIYDVVEAVWTGQSACGECDWAIEAGQKRIADLQAQQQNIRNQDNSNKESGARQNNSSRSDSNAARNNNNNNDNRQTRKKPEPYYKTDADAGKQAKELGFTKIKERSHGQAVFKKDNVYITRDVDGHNGGAWKMADSVKNLASKSTRSGTYNADLSKRVGN
jgi:RHS repeat-associated protein